SALVSFAGAVDHGVLPSFPARRSSDLGSLIAFPCELAHEQRLGQPAVVLAAPLAPGHAVRIGAALGQQLPVGFAADLVVQRQVQDRKSTRLNSSHVKISYAVFCLKKKK